VIAIAVVLVWLANSVQPVQLANITPQLAPQSNYIGLFAMTVAGHVDHGSVPLQVTGTINQSGTFAAVLELDTRPSGISRWHRQPACCTILSSSSAGSSFAGSASLSVASPQTFEFQLVSSDGDNTVLAAGTLAVRLESFPGPSKPAINIIIGGLGLIAALSEIWRLWPRPRAPAEPAPLNGQGEPDAQQ